MSRSDLSEILQTPVFICATTYLQASEQPRYLQNRPSTLHESDEPFALSPSSSPTPIHSAQSPSPLCLPSPLFALDDLTNQEKITRETLTNKQSHDFAALLATHKQSEKSIIAQALKKKRLAQKEMNFQERLVKQRPRAVRAWQNLHPDCKPTETLLCPATGEIFYTKSGRSVLNPDDYFKRP